MDDRHLASAQGGLRGVLSVKWCRECLTFAGMTLAFLAAIVSWMEIEGWPNRLHWLMCWLHR